MLKEALTLIGVLLSLVVLSMFVFLILFEHQHMDSPLAVAVFIVLLLFFDLFTRIRIILSRKYNNSTGWRKARKYAGFGTLFLIFPLMWMQRTQEGIRFGMQNLNTSFSTFEHHDKNMLAITVVYNLIIGFI